MKKLISFGKIDKKFLCIFMIFTCFIITNFIFLISLEDEEINSSPNFLVKSFITNFVKTLCFIPELIVKKISSINNSSQPKAIIKTKYIFYFGIVSFLLFINEIIGLLEDIEEEAQGYELNTSFIFLDYFFLFFISKYFLNIKYYKHQYISIFILLIINIIKDAITLFELGFKKTIFNCILLIFETLISTISLGFYRFLMDKFFFSPFKVAYLFGITNCIILFIISLISTFIPCNNNYYCLIKYNNKNYLDNVISFFNQDLRVIIIACFCGAFEMIKEIIIIIIIQNYTLCHSFLPITITYLFFFDIVQIFSYESFDSGVNLIIVLCYFVLDIFLILIFLEKIELNFCGLNKYLKKNIKRRADKDLKDSDFYDDESSDINDYDEDYSVHYSNPYNSEDTRKSLKKAKIEIQKIND
jgi:hypothetical protein